MSEPLHIRALALGVDPLSLRTLSEALRGINEPARREAVSADGERAVPDDSGGEPSDEPSIEERGFFDEHTAPGSQAGRGETGSRVDIAASVEDACETLAAARIAERAYQLVVYAPDGATLDLCDAAITSFFEASPTSLLALALDAGTESGPLWEALGLSADPLTSYDVVATTTTAATTGGTVSCRVWYTTNQ